MTPQPPYDPGRNEGRPAVPAKTNYSVNDFAGEDERTSCAGHELELENYTVPVQCRSASESLCTSMALLTNACVSGAENLCETFADCQHGKVTQSVGLGDTVKLHVALHTSSKTTVSVA